VEAFGDFECASARRWRDAAQIRFASSHSIFPVAESDRVGCSVKALLREATISDTREGTMHASLSSDDERGKVADCRPALAEASRNLLSICVVGISCQTVMGATLAAAEATR
jgi:hypothetical protein